MSNHLYCGMTYWLSSPKMFVSLWFTEILQEANGSNQYIHFKTTTYAKLGHLSSQTIAEYHLVNILLANLGILHFVVYTFLSFRAKREIFNRLAYTIRFLVVSLLEMIIKSVNYFLTVMKDVQIYNIKKTMLVHSCEFVVISCAKYFKLFEELATSS